MTKQEQNNLAIRLQGGSGDRYELFDSILPLIRQTVTRYRAIEHADAVQEAYVAFDKAVETYDPAKGHFICLAMVYIENWLRDKMTAKARQDGFRRSKRPDLKQLQPQGLAILSLNQICDEDPTFQPSAKPPPVVPHDRVEDMLYGLPDEQKQILSLRAHNTPWPECAKIMGLSKPQCERRFRLGRLELRKREGIKPKLTQR